MNRRSVEIVVISDIHLGTYGCQAAELTHYLHSIKPKILILNGDIIDIWQFSKRYWPRDHMEVVKALFDLAQSGTQVYYLTGNHDDILRKLSDFSLVNVHLLDQLVMEIDGKKTWFFHGDIFDASIQHARWLAKLGGLGYDWLILINSLVNRFLVRMGRPKFSFSQKIKQRVKQAVKFIQDFEEYAAQLAISKGYEYVVCGHIHQPQIRQIHHAKGSIWYLNSGDWIENLTALEYDNHEWNIYSYHDSSLEQESIREAPSSVTLSPLSSKRPSFSSPQPVFYKYS